MGLGMKTKQILANETAKRYRHAKRTTKTKIQVKVKKSKKRQKRIGKAFYTEKDLESLKGTSKYSFAAILRGV
ncbi:MAG: hypothetical protein Ta2B_24550 [Termitinemataceae bacterium]|nr:MAG: hypothetical protein Ta2B_24550 [Termitinemataceae bacterium]